MFGTGVFVRVAVAVRKGVMLAPGVAVHVAGGLGVKVCRVGEGKTCRVACNAAIWVFTRTAVAFCETSVAMMAISVAIKSFVSGCIAPDAITAPKAKNISSDTAIALATVFLIGFSFS